MGMCYVGMLASLSINWLWGINVISLIRGKCQLMRGWKWPKISSWNSRRFLL